MKLSNIHEATYAGQDRIPDGITILPFSVEVGETLEQIINGFNYPYLIGPTFLLVYDIDAPEAMKDIEDASR